MTPSYPIIDRNPQKAWFFTIDAVAEGFTQLSWAQIAKPPERMFDAALARQVAFYVLCERLGAPKRRMVTIGGMSREYPSRCKRVIEKRMKTPHFRDHIEAIEARARQLLAEAG